MKVPLRRKQSVVATLINREYGTPSPFWSSWLILRLSMFCQRRKWDVVAKAKCTGVVDFNYDLQWIVLAQNSSVPDMPHSQMKRIHSNGTYQVVYQIPNVQRIRDFCIYDLPHPVYSSKTKDYEFRPTIIALRKPNILTRHDMEKGIEYDTLGLGKVIMKNLSWNCSLDQLILSSSKYKNPENYWTIAFKIFKLHPLSHLASIAISAKAFPENFRNSSYEDSMIASLDLVFFYFNYINSIWDFCSSRKSFGYLNKIIYTDDRRQYGQFRHSEIDGSFLLVMTDKSYTLIYSAEDIIKLADNDCNSSADCYPCEIEKAPPILFATAANMDILSFGGSPWMYIRSVNDGVLEVRDVGNEELIEGGRVCFDETEVKISPDYLTFHMDDSNRVIHVKNSDLSKQQEEDKKQNCIQSWTTRFGRKVHMKVSLDPSLNRGLTFGLESDLNLFFILEMHREMVGVVLSKVTFYDNNTYEVLLELPLNLHVSGDIEDNRIMMEKDIFSIVNKRQNSYTYFVFRLTYDNEENADVENKNMKSPSRPWSLRRRNSNPERKELVCRSRRVKTFLRQSSCSDDDDAMTEDEWRP
ncbi:DDB1- and CUL4-associated factor 17 [Armadillidium vulgare]|nr:DDB1- and CUL4-associated factor 17 [Armadillidium vulgare]